MSENFPTFPPQSHTGIREIQQADTGVHLGPVEENSGTDDVNTTVAFQRTAPGILGRPYNSGDHTTMPVFNRGQHAGFVMGTIGTSVD